MSTPDKDKKKDKDKKDKEKDKDKDKEKDKKKDKDKDKKKDKSNVETNQNQDDLSALSFEENPQSGNNKFQVNEKCDGCYVQDAVVYCSNCEKAFCKMCNDQMHIIPRLRSHNRVDINMMYSMRKLCYNHGSKLDMYCETCEEPICVNCFNLGPHNTRLHRVVMVVDSFRKKFTSIKQLINSNLRGRYDLYSDQIGFMDFNIEEIKQRKLEIERQIQQEFLTMMDKVKSQEGKKMASLNYDSALVQKEINKIQDFCNFVSDNAIGNHPDMLDFLLKFKKMKLSIEETLECELKSNIIY